MNQDHAIVIGGTRGLGRGLVDLWADGSRAVSVIGRQSPSTTDASPREGLRHYAADITEHDTVRRTLDEIVRVAGPVSRLVFLQRFRGTGDSLTGELEVGLIATQRIIDHLRDQFAKPAAIVVVSSIASRSIAAEQPLGYHVTKAALEQLVRFYAVQLAPRGIRVNAVAPSLIQKDESHEFYRQHPELKRHYESLIPLGRLGTPRDIALAIDFLCDERSAYITGQTLVVDGGLTLPLQHSLMAKPSATSTPTDGGALGTSSSPAHP